MAMGSLPLEGCVILTLKQVALESGNGWAVEDKHWRGAEAKGV